MVRVDDKKKQGRMEKKVGFSPPVTYICVHKPPKIMSKIKAVFLPEAEQDRFLDDTYRERTESEKLMRHLAVALTSSEMVRKVKGDEKVSI
jgi:hypothetical protein